MFSSLSEALQSLGAFEMLPETVAALIDSGPGVRYIVEMDSTRILFISSKGRSFIPASFYKLATEQERWENLIHVDDLRQYREALEELKTQDQESRAAYRIATSKNGGLMPLADNLTPIKNTAGEIVAILGNAQNNSREIQSMDTLVKQSWKELSATMTRRFLHDFNNTIAGIYSLSELYSIPGSSVETMTEAMGHIRKSAERAQLITKRIRSLIAVENEEESFYDLENLLEEQREFLDALLPKTTTLDLRLSGASMTVRLDANRFKQALFNLVANASESTEEESTIYIQIHLTENSDGKACAKVEVRDNGSGITDRTRNKIFDPFFTTKDRKRHAGMGLFIVKEFVEHHGGEVSIEPSKPIGAIVSMTIPLVDLTESIEPSATTETTNTVSEGHSSLQKKKTPTILIYTWEDITRHPLINSIREANWKFRIHLDPFQMMLDAKEMEERLDGLIVFKSSLDEKADPLIQEIASMKKPPKVALVTLGESVDALPDTVKSICGFVSNGTAKPGPVLKKLSAYLA